MAINMNPNNAVNLIVGGMFYSLLLIDIQAHEGCYFASVIKDEWNRSDEPIVIDRDGVLFQHILVYLYSYRTKMRFTLEGSLALLVEIRREADFYNLTKLVALCDTSYDQKLIRWCKDQSLATLCHSYILQTKAEDASELDALIASEVYPGCHTGSLNCSWFSSFRAEGNLFPLTLWGGSRNKNFHAMELKRYDELECYENLRAALPTMPGVKCDLVFDLLCAVTKDGYEQGTDGHGAFRTNNIGTIGYILRSTFTGGVITATYNGESKSISKPGEYIMYTNEYTRDISTVTSGALVFVTFRILNKIGEDDHTNYDDDFWLTLLPYNPLPCIIGDQLIQAVHKELNSGNIDNSGSNNSVVLCLSALYPIVEFDPSGPYLETDPDSLRDRDAMLYACLKDTFAVTLVTVYVHRYFRKSSGCVLGPAPAPTTDESKIKIIAPFHNFRESSEIKNPSGFVALYTALYIKKKE